MLLFRKIWRALISCNTRFEIRPLALSEKIYKNDVFPKNIIIDKIEINDAKNIAEKFDEHFVKVGPNLASEISKSNINFKSFIPKITTTLNETDVAQ